MEKRPRRIHFRLNIDWSAKFQCEKEHSVMEIGRLLDISLGGVRLASNIPLRPGDCISLRIRMPNNAREWETSLEVVRTIKPSLWQRISPFCSHRYRVGAKFTLIGRENSNTLGKFIAGKAKFPFIRWTSFYLSAICVLAAFAHAGVYFLLGIFKNTRFGNEWLDPRWHEATLWGISALHILYAILLAAACLGFLFFNATARKIAIGLTTIGISSQICRLAGKYPLLLSGDRVSQVIYFFELAAFLFLTCLFLILTAKSVRMNFDLVQQRITDYRDGNVTPYDGRIE